MEKENKAEKTTKTTRTRRTKKSVPKKETVAEETAIIEENKEDSSQAIQEETPETTSSAAEVSVQEPSINEEEVPPENSEPITSSDNNAQEMEARFQAAQMEIAQEQIDETISSLIQAQRTFFSTGTTQDPAWRIEQLKNLHAAIREHEAEIVQALRQDLSKSEYESYSSEIGLVLSEITYQIKHIKKWSKEKRIFGDIHLFPAYFTKRPEPYGVTLIMSTWNYPFLLSISPLVNALAAGNTAILKTSEYSTATNNVIDTLLAKTFNANYVTVVQGGYNENHALLNQHFDFIFFTGSQNVGKIVMNSASRFLTPVCLELGGKSPCIIDNTSNLEMAAKRIVWGKFLNAGQTCVAPDYILVDENVKQNLIECLKKEITSQFSEKPLENPDYPKIINERHFVHLTTLCPDAQMDFVSNKIAPTVIDLGNIKSSEIEDSQLMKGEIFGPLLPVISYQHISDVINFISSRPSPLALYLFSTDKELQQTITKTLRFGGGCINDVVCHLASSKVPFGGIGESGMGSYHGKTGFDTFSHVKTILVQSEKTKAAYRFNKTEKNLKLLKFFLR
ncbi:MAG: aldehyde dehydrogenase family protein [Treponema sp.]|nr:aldehyde dehydrogenase family protein [Treponema sp.]